MKKILIFTTCIMAALCITMCKKSDTKTTTNNATCRVCSLTPVGHNTDASGASYFLPTAFTPNGDGLNDVFSLFYTGLDTNNSSLTIWTISGTEVFTGRITQRWNGYDLNGKKCGAGQYPVFLQIKTTDSLSFSTCACVNLLVYSGSCINTGGATYYFPDQIDTAGFAFATNETLCP